MKRTIKAMAMVMVAIFAGVGVAYATCDYWEYASGTLYTEDPVAAVGADSSWAKIWFTTRPGETGHDEDQPQVVGIANASIGGVTQTFTGVYGEASGLAGRAGDGSTWKSSIIVNPGDSGDIVITLGEMESLF